MASLHHFNHQVGVTLGNIGQKNKSFAEVAGAVKKRSQMTAHKGKRTG